MEIRKVLIRKDGIKYLVVPKNSDIIAGDYVLINKLNQEELKNDRRKERKR